MTSDSALPKILVVDDEPDLRGMMKDILKPAGFDVVTAANGREAYALCEKQEFSFILTDERMPGGSGLEFISRLPELKRPLPPIALMTGHSISNINEINQLGVGRIFKKPFSMRDVVAHLRKSLNLKP